ncbi:MAG: lysylphosphatidylglycerol synthase transmembrane domain-containing protein [Acidimicrobiia bacterium]
MPNDHNDGDPELAFEPSQHTPEEDAKRNRKKAIRELILVGVVLFLIFVVFLPQFIDYGQVVDSILELSIGQMVVLAVFGIAFTWFSAGVYNTLIPGLGWWEGWKAWAASNSVAFVAPPGADLAIRFGMYRTAGVSGEAAGAGLILSWFFATGYKLVVPIIALFWVLIEEGLDDDLFATIAIVGLAAIIGGACLVALVLYRESIAVRIGEIGQRWYNGLVGGRWKFPEASGLGVKLADFRAEVQGTLRARWFPAVAVTLTAQAIFFIALVLSMRFMGVTEEQASVGLIFDAYAVGLLLSMIPIFPGGLGVVELTYVTIIVGGDPSANPDLANAVTAGAFVHRIFTWLLPILIGLVPLAGWRRNMVAKQEAEAMESDSDRLKEDEQHPEPG